MDDQPESSNSNTSSAPKSDNITWHHGSVSRDDRAQLNEHRGATLWFTGLSGSGKSTLTRALEARLHARGVRVYVLDGDNVRHGLNRDLGFAPEDRTENVRRVAEVARLMADAGLLCLTAFISPYRDDRAQARARHEPGDFMEVYVECDLSVCESRDPKGLYAKARSGEIGSFTGISAPYEAPEAAEVRVRTDLHSVEACVDTIERHLEQAGYLSP